MMSSIRENGISVIVCCYNSAKRIDETLEALSKQRTRKDMMWEVIVVDNASTDNTAEIARLVWESLPVTTELRVVRENKPGLGHARAKGMQEAAFGLVLFCDDDNRLADDYVQGMYNILVADAGIAACGGTGIPVFETSKPVWFDEYREAFAVGPQDINMIDGKILNLYGAGLGLRKAAVEQLHRAGFRPMMEDRVGASLSSSGDTELTYSFVLAGYRLHYAKELEFFHYLPKERLTIAYLKKLFVAFGNDGPVRNLYYARISDRPFHKRITRWNFHLALSLFRLVKYALAPPKKYGRSIYFSWNLSYIRQLLAMRKNYREVVARVYGIRQTAVAEPGLRAQATFPVFIETR